MTRKRNRCRIWPRWSGAVAELYDYAGQPPPRPGRPIPSSGEIVVTDDWPDMVPINDADVRVIESHFAEELDDLFGPLA